MMGVRKRAFGGVFIEENAHRSRSPCLHLQGKWSIPQNAVEPSEAALQEQALQRLFESGEMDAPDRGPGAGFARKDENRRLGGMGFLEG